LLLSFGLLYIFNESLFVGIPHSIAKPTSLANVWMLSPYSATQTHSWILGDRQGKKDGKGRYGGERNREKGTKDRVVLAPSPRSTYDLRSC